MNYTEAISRLIEYLSGGKLNFPLSRNQGVYKKNFVYGKVIGNLKDILIGSKHRPINYFFRDPDSDFDSSGIINLLEQLKDELKEGNPADLFEKYENLLLEMWEQEDQS
jgi:hypothetical protein